LIRIFNSEEEALNRIGLNKAIRVEADGRKICIVNSKGNLHAIQGLCPHLGEGLHKGTINYLGEIVCLWHSYRFSLLTGEESSRNCQDAKIYSIKIKADGVYLDI